MSIIAKLREAELAKLFDECAQDDNELRLKAGRARELDTALHGLALLSKSNAELAELGWTRADLRIALDGKLPQKDCPTYLIKALERVDRRMQNHSEAPKNSLTLIQVNNVGFSKEELEAAPVIDIDGR